MKDVGRNLTLFQKNMKTLIAFYLPALPASALAFYIPLPLSPASLDAVSLVHSPFSQLPLPFLIVFQ